MTKKEIAMLSNYQHKTLTPVDSFQHFIKMLWDQADKLTDNKAPHILCVNEMAAYICRLPNVPASAIGRAIEIASEHALIEGMRRERQNTAYALNISWYEGEYANA